MKILITGCPGTGKTSISEQLSKALGSELIKINDIVDEKKLWSRKGKFGEKIVKMKELERLLNSILKKKKKLIVEGHLGCDLKLNVSSVIVLRTKPSILKKRLIKKQFQDEKLWENLLAEMLDYCSISTEKNYPLAKIYEIDTSLDVKTGIMKVKKIIEKKSKGEKIDWGNYLKKFVSGKI